jgi:hypothetical protein
LAQATNSNISDIAKRLNRSKSIVSNSLRCLLSDNISRRKGKAAKFSPRTKRLLFEVAFQGKLSALKLVSELDFNRIGGLSNSEIKLIYFRNI